MTGRGQLTLRAQAALDRLAWGFGDLRRALMERGAWPAGKVSAVAADGSGWLVTGGRLRKRSGGAGKAAGLLVPESECLWGEVRLPAVQQKVLGGAVQEALWRVSPLPPDQIIAAWTAQPDAQGGWAVQWGMCRRSVRDQLFSQYNLRDDAAVFLVRQGRALPVHGPTWQRLSARQRWMDAGGLVLLAAVLVALALPALMPLILKRQAVVKAVQHVDLLVPKAAPLREKMDELRRQAAVADELRKNVSTDLPLASVIDTLSAVLPGDTWLDRVEVNGPEIRITGLTSNASELITQLGRHPALADVRATGASVREGTSNKERFTFEMRWRGEGVKP